MSEVNAALGLLQLKKVEDLIKSRSSIDILYRKKISSIEGIKCHQISRAFASNFAYFPIFVGPEYPLSRDELHEKLKKFGFHTRKYFYPLITSFPMYKHYQSANKVNHPVAVDAAQKVLCLPIFPELSEQLVIKLCDLIAHPLINCSNN